MKLLVLLCVFFRCASAFPSAAAPEDAIAATAEPASAEITIILSNSTVQNSTGNQVETTTGSAPEMRSSRQGRIMNYRFGAGSNNVTSGVEKMSDFKLGEDGPAKAASGIFESLVSGSKSGSEMFESLMSGSKSGAAYGASGSASPQNLYASSVSYSNPDFLSGASGIQPADLLPYYYDRKSSKVGQRQPPVMYQLVPFHKPKQTPEYNFHDAIKDTLYKVKDSVTYGVQKFKNSLGFNGFSEKISAPETLLSVAPMAAGLLAGGLAVAYLASRSAGARSNVTSSPFPFFGRRSARGIMNEEGLNLIVSRLDPVQREYLQKLQLYGPQRWKDTNCAKFIFCDVMSKATPLHIFDMQRKVGVFLSRMDESTARYVEMILKDVMLAIQARDCRRFSCAPTPWGVPSGAMGGGGGPFAPFNGHNFLRRQ